MSGFVFGLLVGLFIGIVLTAFYMLAAVTQREFAENGWAMAWDMLRQVRRWSKLVSDYESAMEKSRQIAEMKDKTIETLMQALDRQKGQKQEG